MADLPVYGSEDFWEAMGYKDPAKIAEFTRQFKEEEEFEKTLRGLPLREANRQRLLWKAQKFIDSLKGATTLPASYPYIDSYEEYIRKYPKSKLSKVEYYVRVLPNEPPIDTELPPKFEIIDRGDGEFWAYNPANYRAIRVILGG